MNNPRCFFFRNEIMIYKLNFLCEDLRTFLNQILHQNLLLVLVKKVFISNHIFPSFITHKRRGYRAKLHNCNFQFIVIMSLWFLLFHMQYNLTWKLLVQRIFLDYYSSLKYKEIVIVNVKKRRDKCCKFNKILYHSCNSILFILNHPNFYD